MKNIKKIYYRCKLTYQYKKTMHQICYPISLWYWLNFKAIFLVLLVTKWNWLEIELWFVDIHFANNVLPTLSPNNWGVKFVKWRHMFLSYRIVLYMILCVLCIINSIIKINSWITHSRILLSLNTRIKISICPSISTIYVILTTALMCSKLRLNIWQDSKDHNKLWWLT